MSCNDGCCPFFFQFRGPKVWLLSRDSFPGLRWKNRKWGLTHLPLSSFSFSSFFFRFVNLTHLILYSMWSNLQQQDEGGREGTIFSPDGCCIVGILTMLSWFVSFQQQQHCSPFQSAFICIIAQEFYKKPYGLIKFITDWIYHVKM